MDTTVNISVVASPTPLALLLPEIVSMLNDTYAIFLLKYSPAYA